jgi:hypothetical protein
MIPNWYRTHDDKGNYLYPIEFYIERLKNNQPFTRSNFSDGEFRLAINERYLVNVRGGEEVPEAKELLIKAANYIKSGDPNFFLASLDQEKIDGYLNRRDENNPDGEEVFRLIEGVGLKDYKWHGGLVFFYACLEGKLKPFIEELNKKRVVIISIPENRCLKEKGFNYEHYIDSETTQDYGRKQWRRIVKEVLDYGKPAVYLLCCGEASAFAAIELHNKIPGAYFMDIGKCLDFLAETKYWGHNICEGETPAIKEQKRQKMYELIRSNLLNA